MSEAIVAGVPILASRVAGNVGILGRDYGGLFTAGDTKQLARLLSRAESESEFLAQLRSRIQKLGPFFDPAHEEKAWASLIGELHLR